MLNPIENVSLAYGTITEVRHIVTGEFRLPDGLLIASLPSFWRVAVNLKPTPGSDINVEVWLPTNGWNGRFLGTGNGGGAGSIAYWALADGIRQGYATANTDMGTSPNANCAVGQPERWADFGWRATHEMTVAAKKIIEAYYGKPASRTYFTGGSTGGQQALMEAQRFPLDYDGIIAGVPANNRTLLHSSFLWNFKALNQQPGSSLLPEELVMVTKKMLSLRTIRDGGTPGDSFFNDPRSCEVDLDSALANLPLSANQISALKNIYMGPVNPRTGERIYTPLPIGSESMPLGLQFQQDPEHCPKDLLYIFRWAFGEDFDWWQFDFDHDLDVLQERLAPLLNANNSDLSEMKKTGGKVLMFSGTADPLVPYQDALHYYERVVEAQGGIDQTQEFFRFFLVPGRCHGEDGSPGFGALGGKTEGESLLSAMVDWVERGNAPDRLIATANRNGRHSDGQAAQRPVYAYPKFAEYTTGDADAPSSYRAVEHPRGNVPKPAERYLRG